jgi:hypothetical protein
LGALTTTFEENPVMAKTLSAAQKKALAQGRAKLKAERAASGKKPSSKKRSSGKKRSSSRKTKSGKRTLSSKQRAALARGRATAAANRAAAAAAAPPKAPSKKRSSPKRKRAAIKKAKKSQSRVVVARASIARAGRALAPRRAPRKPKRGPDGKIVRRTPPKTINSGRYTNRKGQTVVIRRTYARANPTVEFRQIAFAGGGLALGWVAAEMIDRYVATRAPKDAKDALKGDAAAIAINAKPDSMRLLASGGGTLAFGLSAYMLKDRAPDVAYGLGGVGAGFGIKFFSQVVGDLFLPWLFKVDKTKKDFADSYGYRLFPDKQYFEKKEETPATPFSARGYMRGPYGQVGSPRPWAGMPQQTQVPYPFVVAPAQQADVGPVATGAVGCGGSSMRAIYGQGSPGDVFCPTCGSCGDKRRPHAPCPSCASEPEPVPPPDSVPETPEGWTPPAMERIPGMLIPTIPNAEGTVVLPRGQEPRFVNLAEMTQPRLVPDTRGAEQQAVKMMTVSGFAGQPAQDAPAAQPAFQGGSLYAGAASVMAMRRTASRPRPR